MPRSVEPVLRGARVHKTVIAMLAASLALCAPSWQGTPEHQISASSPAGLPTGLRLLGNLDRLPDLRNGVFAGQVSSHDKTGLGSDFGHQPDDGTESYLYQEEGSYVLFDRTGPGAITRLWFTWYPSDPAYGDISIQFYFDGAPDPAIDLTLSELFSGEVSPFLHPMVGHEGQSSGGYYSYVPLPFQDSLKITTSSVPAYHSIGFETYAPDVTVVSFTGQEDYAQAFSVMENAGLDPKATDGNLIESGTLSIPPGAEATLFQRTGPGVINSLRLRIPQIVPAPIHNRLMDDGRVINTGKSEFAVQVDPANTGVRLTRRLDYATADQVAEVYVDGALVDEWSDPGSDGIDRWRDSSFDIPQSFTAGKSELRIEVRDIFGGAHWTEYYYWIRSEVGGEFVLTDSLDVRNPNSEASHQYEVVLQKSAPRLTSTYPPVAGDAQAQQASRELLTKTRIVGYWDGETSASVDAPIGGFFGSWAGEADVTSLMMGMEPEGSYYSYFPMPFASGASLKIRNDSSVSIDSLSYEVAYSPEQYPGLGETAGYFHATASEQLPTTTGEDYVLLDVTGTGHIVGSVLFTKSLPGWKLGYLEGDERIHVDGSASPALYGTGTEDYFNAGYYFSRGTISLPTHGYPLHFLPVEDGSTIDETGTYRLHLFDPISFRSGIRFGFEHGDSVFKFSSNTWNADYYSVVFWYGLSQPQATLTDTLDVGDAGAEEAHGYSAAGASETMVEAYYYEGDNDDVSVADDGHTASGTVEFDLALAPDNGGAVLRRRADQGIRNQEALVSVDGEQIGTWYDPGRNTSKRWLDSEFVLPRSATYGKSSVRIELEPQSGVPWSAYTYWAYTLRPSTGEKFTQDADADTVADGFDPDDDNDGCIDLREIGSDPTMGGLRDQYNFWDFFDTPNPNADPRRDQHVSIGDILRVVRRFGSTGDPGGDPLSVPPDAPAFHTAYDRGGTNGQYPWNLLPPDGVVSVGDIRAIVAQFGHSCA